MKNNNITNIIEYNINIPYYTFNNISELYLYCDCELCLPLNLTFVIILEIEYRKVEYNEIVFWYESKYYKKIAHVTAYKIYEFINGSFQFYCNYEK